MSMLIIYEIIKLSVAGPNQQLSVVRTIVNYHVFEERTLVQNAFIL